ISQNIYFPNTLVQSGVGKDPVGVGRHPGVDTGEGGITTLVAPRRDTNDDVLLNHHGATLVSIAEVLAALVQDTSADHSRGDLGLLGVSVGLVLQLGVALGAGLLVDDLDLHALQDVGVGVLSINQAQPNSEAGK
ncbi:unnamed protein product, partial [Plutella xylostella]